MRRIYAAAFAVFVGLCPVAAFAQSAPLTYDSQANLNPTIVVVGKAQLRLLNPMNTTTTVYWLKFYDVSVAPTCGTTLPVKFKVPVPFGAANSGGGAVIPVPDGLQFQNGIGFCLTGAQADNDTTNAATGLVINLGVKQ